LTSNTTICNTCIIINNKQRVTIFIDPALAKHARAQAVIEEITLTALFEKALIKYLPEETIIKKPAIETDLNKG